MVEPLSLEVLPRESVADIDQDQVPFTADGSSKLGPPNGKSTAPNQVPPSWDIPLLGDWPLGPDAKKETETPDSSDTLAGPEIPAKVVEQKLDADAPEIAGGRST